jgi:hypothetical protein
MRVPVECACLHAHSCPEPAPGVIVTNVWRKHPAIGAVERIQACAEEMGRLLAIKMA